jgi:hypothetical protein
MHLHNCKYACARGAGALVIAQVTRESESVLYSALNLGGLVNSSDVCQPVSENSAI